jgi:hydrogenase maturation protease
MTCPAVAPTLVLALGNPERGDDGVGQAVVRELSARGGLPTGVEILDGGLAGLEICLLMRGRRQVLIVDAAEMGVAPGEWRSLEVAEPLLAGEFSPGGLHGAGLREALQLSAALQELPERVTVFGIQPERIDWGSGLSRRVARAVPAVGTAIQERILHDKDGCCDGEDPDC